MDEKQFKVLNEKLNRIIALLTVQNIQDKDNEIHILKNLGLSSSEVALLVGMTDNGVRSSKGWKGK